MADRLTVVVGKGCVPSSVVSHVVCLCRWRIWGRNRRIEAVVEATCESSGTPLRAPTANTGLAPFCRDSFAGQVGVAWDRAGSVEVPPGSGSR